MSNTDDLNRGGDPTCGCCAGIEEQTPSPTTNRPGLDLLRYRTGTHASFLATMKARLSNLALELPPADGTEPEQEPQPQNKVYPLDRLTTRAADDPTIALLDAWATVADLLTFYQERIANEGFLRTAGERRSLLELARLVGYAPRPGVAASVFLAFTVDDNYDEVEIPKGTRAQSIPASDGEMPQYFETSADLVARSTWNGCKPRLTRPQPFLPPFPLDPLVIYLAGTATNLKPGDTLVLSFVLESTSQHWRYRVLEVEADADNKRTRIGLGLWMPAPRYLLAERAAAPERDASELVKAAIADVRKVTKSFLDLEKHRISAGGRMAKRVVKFLRTIDEQLEEDLGLTDLHNLLGEWLGIIEGEHAQAVENRYTNLEPWTGAICDALREIRSTLPSPVTGLKPVKLHKTRILTQLLDGLGRPPSLQPASVLELRRDLRTSFRPGSGLVLQTLATLDPRIGKKKLFTAWSSTKVTAFSSLSDVDAMRLTALPFGVTAPLKPVHDDKGVLTGQQEWPLAGTTGFGVQLYHYRESQNVRIVATFTEADVTCYGETNLSPNSGTVKTTITLREDFEVSLEASYADGGEGRLLDLSVAFPSIPSRSFTITLTEEVDFPLEVTIDGKDARRMASDTSVYYMVADSSVKLSLAADPYTYVLSLDMQSPLPVRSDQRSTLTLDAQYEQIVPGSMVVVDRGDRLIFAEVQNARTVARSAYGISAKVTELVLSEDWLSETDCTVRALRDTTIHAGAERLTPAEEPILDDIAGSTIELAGTYDGLATGRWLIISGERTDLGDTKGVMASELVMIAGIRQDVQRIEINSKAYRSGSENPGRDTPDLKFPLGQEGRETIELPGDKIHTFVDLANSLAYTYRRDTVTIFGNVVNATHGESRSQVLGSGNGSQSWQSFPLGFKPLTHLAAATAAGADSTLEVRVNEVLWHEAPSAAALAPDDRCFLTLTGDDDTTTVIFGDGARGVRLPTGVENVTAEYRQGIGAAGNVAAEQISQLATQQLGVRGVSNPLPATGGADRDGPEEIRRNAPLMVSALDRLVSVQDYADFSRTFAGIAKARACRFPDGRRHLVCLTIAGIDDGTIAATSDLYRNLRAALKRCGDPNQPVTVKMRELMLLVIAARVRVLPDYRWQSVEPQIRAALLQALGFGHRDLGQDVSLAEVIAIMQAVEGVACVDVDTLDRVEENITPDELEAIADDLTRYSRIVVATARIRTTHRVQRSGETLFSVASRHGLSVEELTRLNPGMTRPLRKGDTLRIPRTVAPAQLAYLSPDLPDTLILTEWK